jgi:hypothetical protein
MINIDKIKNYIKLIREIILNFYGGTSVAALICEILIYKSKKIKTKKQSLIKSIQSYHPVFNKCNDLIRLNHFSKNLKNDIEKIIKTDRRTIIFLKHSMLYHLWFGSFVNCQYFRNLYRKKLIFFQQHQNFLDLNAVRAAVELNKRYLLSAWFKKKKISKLDNDFSKVFLNYLKFGSHESFSDLELSQPSMVDLVHNKKIIIIGPAPDDEIQSLEILNKYDISVGANYVSGRDTKFNISYYGGLIKKVDPAIVVNSFKDLDFACIVSPYLDMLKFDPIQSLKVRSFEEDLLTLMLIFKSRPNMIQDIVLDLLKHNPKKIYLCGINFFLGKKTYREKSYAKFVDNERKKNGVLKTLRAHDPFANFAFLKNVWTNGLIEVSEDLKSVISLTENEFSKKLDNLSITDF